MNGEPAQNIYTSISVGIVVADYTVNSHHMIIITIWMI